jgi:glycosyltransferase involved in cell wall biosynthesis
VLQVWIELALRKFVCPTSCTKSVIVRPWSKSEVSLSLDEIAVISQANDTAIPLDRGGREQPGPNCPAVSITHLVIIPSFNSGRLLASTVAAARTYWAPVWVVIDGSTDNSAAAVETMAQTDPALRILYLPKNRGKGAAVRQGVIAAQASGFTHVLVMDADGQHPADRIPLFMAISAEAPDALVMGRPVFGGDAPWVRVVARRLCNGCAAVETLRHVGDTLFGFRVYPVATLLSVMQESNGMQGFDFDPEAVVRFAWHGVPLIHLPTPVRYLSRAEGGISHFKYLRDNVLLTGMHLRLGLTAIVRLMRTARLRGTSVQRTKRAAQTLGASDNNAV